MNLLFPDEMILRDAGMRNGSRIFRLVHYYRVITSFGTVTIPTGFETDGASIPRAFWNILQPFGEYFPAALLHDYLYSKASNGRFETDRWEADLLFLEAMYNLGVPWHTRHVIHSAVRAFGWKSYKKR
jgi:hypothetical protein